MSDLFIVGNKQLSVTAAKGATAYSSGVRATWFRGGMAVLITPTAGSVTVSLQVSIDNTTFYDAVDAGGNTLGAIAGAVTAAKYVAFKPVIAPYFRFKVVEADVAATVVAIDVVATEG